MGRTPLFYASRAGSLVDINDLVKYGANVNHKSVKGQTALYKARTYETVMLLLKYGADYTITDNKGRTAIERLLKFNSKCPMAILDECMTRQPNETLIMDFRVFDSKECFMRKGDNEQHEVQLYLEAQKKRRTVLFLHPLMQIFMSLKFTQVNVNWIANIICQLAFTIALSGLGVSFADFIHCTNDTSTWTGDSFNKSKVECSKHTLTPLKKHTHLEFEIVCEALYLASSCWHRYWIHIVVKLFLVFKIINEFYWIWLYTHIKYLKTYISDLEHIISLMIIVLSLFFISVSQYKLSLAGHIVGWIVFFAWIDWMLLLGKADEMGRYILMSVDVMKTMVFVLITYIPCFLAFVFGFYVFLKPNEKFGDYFATFVKVLSMMVGELNYDEDFSYDGVKETGGTNLSVQIMFILFEISVMLIVLNLLLAVTVSKTEGLVDKSIMMQTAGRIDDVMLPTFAPKWLVYFRKFFQTTNIKNKTMPIIKRCQQKTNGKFRKVIVTL